MGIKKYWVLDNSQGDKVSNAARDIQLLISSELLCKAFIMFFFDIQLAIIDSEIYDSFKDLNSQLSKLGWALIYRSNNERIDKYLRI